MVCHDRGLVLVVGRRVQALTLARAMSLDLPVGGLLRNTLGILGVERPTWSVVLETDLLLPRLDGECQGIVR